MTERKPWDRLPDESPKAYAAFRAYYLLPVESRSIDAAWRKSAKKQQKVGGKNLKSKRAPRCWFRWSAENDWAARSAAYDEHLANKEREEYEKLWLERRRELRERDWSQADALRKLFDESVLTAEQFVRERRQVLPAKNGQPEREIITQTFDVSALVRALVDASKLQRLATDESTDNINISGSALDAAIERELAKLANGTEAPTAIASASDAGS